MPKKGENTETKDNEPKKPKPRRLFSFDNIRSATPSQHSSSDEIPTVGRTVNPLELYNVRGGQEKGEDVARMAMHGQLVTEPAPESPSMIGLDTSRAFNNRLPSEPATSPKLEPVRPIALKATQSFTPESQTPSPSPTRARWESLRQHVAQNRASATPSIRSASAQSPPTPSNFPTRSITPKPSRLARLGFKHVVEQAREMVGDTRKLGVEILRGCAIARFPEVQRPGKENASTVSLGSSTMASASSGGKKMDYMRRPQSIVSISSTSLNSTAPSLRFLYQILIHHSSTNDLTISVYLPHESHVLSTLLCPFLTPSKYPTSNLEEEKIIAMESFELVSKSWTPLDEAATIERCLWCIKAASSLLTNSTRTRILGLLWRLIVPGDRNRILLTTQGFQSLSSGLLMLLVSLYRSSTLSSSPSPFPFALADFQRSPHPDISLLQDLINQFLSGSLGELDDDGLEEVYGTELTATDRRNVGNLRRGIFLDSLVNTIEASSGTGEWLLFNVIEQYWPSSSFDGWTTLQATICKRKVNSFCRLSQGLLQPFINRTLIVPSTPANQMSRSSSSSSSTSINTVNFHPKNSKVPSQVLSILRSRIIPEAEALSAGTELEDKVVIHTRMQVARVLLDIVCLDSDLGNPKSIPSPDIFGGASLPMHSASSDEIATLVKRATDILCQWYRAGNASPWKLVLEKALQHIVTGDWTTSISVLSSLLNCLPADLKLPIFSSIIQILNDQLVQDPPPNTFPALASFLTSLSKALPLVFFKPVFACSNSDKEVIVVNHLCTLQVHSKYVDDYWVRDPEMMCMALMGHTPATIPGGTSGQWGVARLGQLVLLVELIGNIQKIRHEKEAFGSSWDGKLAEIIRFATVLESRLWSMVEAKERTVLFPPSQRLLICMLFREFRLLTRSLRPASWLPRTLEWFQVFFADDDLGELEQEVTGSMERVQGLYIAAREGVQQSNKRHTSMLAASVSKATPVAQAAAADNALDLAASFVQHKVVIDSLSKGYPSKALKLFVTMSTLIADQDYKTLGPLLWQHCLLDNVDSSTTASACFLLMQCAERTHLDLFAVMEVDLQTSDDTTRLEAVRKISILINWRFQILSQSYVTDRTHRLFKLARPALPFMATDMGTSLYIHMEDSSENKDRDDVPLELKQRLAELGWAEEDAGVTDPRQEWIKTPMSILPANQLDRLEVTDSTTFAPPSPLPSPQPSPRPLQLGEDGLALLRRNSSSGGPVNAVKRRAVFVPSLTLIFPRLATLLYDPNFAVASATRTTMLDLMRNDPALLSRPILDYLSGENKDIKLAISTLTALLHVRQVLPPGLTYNVFNNLAGFLKFLAKIPDGRDSLYDFAMVVPVLASLVSQVSGMSIKEIRRTKSEAFFIPSGSLWFTGPVAKGPMFPKQLGECRDPFMPVPPTLIAITMIRVSQNMFFLSMLKRNYQDVQVVRKNMSKLVLPSLDDQDSAKNLDIYDFMPRKHTSNARLSIKKGTAEILSLMVSRSYILLVAQIFRSMPRHLNDRQELAVLIDGLNRTLVAHGDDINIVSQVLIAFMVASTRFRRLFTAGSGYNLFMPALVKVYTENPSHPGIRVAVEYAISRFYALHKDSFLYQSINTIGQLCMLPDIEVDWFAKGVFELFTSLRRGQASAATDVAGIRNANKAEEREALIIHTADEKPQAFLAAIRRVESQTGHQMLLQLPDEYESRDMNMGDFVRLFLTVIAHDLSISRAQHFLRLLRLLVPYLYNASASTRTVLADGVVALGAIMVKAFSKPAGKGADNIPKSMLEEDVGFIAPDILSKDIAQERSKAPSDSKILRMDYLKLVLSFGEIGGQVTLTVARHAMDVLKSLLKDSNDTNMDVLANILGDFAKMLLHREEPATPKAVVAFLQELSPILHAYLSVVNFAAVFDTVFKLAEMANYANDPLFCQVVVGEICTAGLAACDLAASENQIMLLPFRSSLVSLLAQAIFFRDVDMISELEKRPPTYSFLAGVILPLTLIMKTESEVVGDGSRTSQHRTKLALAWLRILFYAMTACQKSLRDEDGTQNAVRGLTGSFRSKSEKGQQENTFWRSHLPTFMTAIQVIKVVVIRGGADINSLPRVGIWDRMTVFFNSILAEGSADFALKPEINSANTTPTQSPRASGQFELSNSGSHLFVSTSSDLNSRPTSPSSAAERPSRYSRPRIVDYSLWSMLEFACAYRSPLRMHLKILIMEKVVTLDQELQRQTADGGRLTPFSASPSRRVSMSPFSKPRQRGSAFMPSPESSPRLMPSLLNLRPPPSLLETPNRRAGYQISPISPHDHPGLPKIVHLGPTMPSTFPPISSPMIGAGLPGVRASRIGTDGPVELSSSTARATRIKSLKLIQDTYKRIRGVQTYMGYDLLLPMPGAGATSPMASMSFPTKDGDEDATLVTWSRQQALTAIMKETKDLLEEFEEILAPDEGISVSVESDPRASYSSG